MGECHERGERGEEVIRASVGNLGGTSLELTICARQFGENEDAPAEYHCGVVQSVYDSGA